MAVADAKAQRLPCSKLKVKMVYFCQVRCPSCSGLLAARAAGRFHGRAFPLDVHVRGHHLQRITSQNSGSAVGHAYGWELVNMSRGFLTRVPAYCLSGRWLQEQAVKLQAVLCALPGLPCAPRGV
jgi:hypothetical protein